MLVRRIVAVRLALALFAAAAVAVGPAGAEVLLRGAGATFPAPLYKKWIDVYTKQHPGVVINYADVGSGEGTARFLEHTIDFGASDAGLSDEQIAGVRVGAKLIPATSGMVVLAY